MKSLLVLLLTFCLAVSISTPLHAQAPAVQDNAPLLSAEDLDDLLGPIALYPDSLIALILPASTVPGDIQQAAQYVNTGGDPSQIPNQPWDDSVKALTRYPTVLNWLVQNIDWTTQLGQAFLNQPADVMDSIQQLRAKAMAEGNLVNTAQQQVVVNDGDITIEQADPDQIYVPQYDPDVVYDEPYSEGDSPFIDFGQGYPVGPWLDYGFDWGHRGIYHGDWRSGRGHQRGEPNITNAKPWRANPDRVRMESRNQSRTPAGAAVFRPKPLPGVTIPHGNRTAPALQTGRVARPIQTAPVAPAPQSNTIFGAYGRGSVTRDESIRGHASRQPPAQVISRPIAPAMVRPPVQTFRPAPVERPPVQQFRPAPVMRAPAPSAPGMNAFHGVSSGRGGRFVRRTRCAKPWQMIPTIDKFTFKKTDRKRL